MLTQKEVAEALGVSQAKISRLFKANYEELEPYFVKTGKKVRLKENAIPLVADYLSSKGYKTGTEAAEESRKLKESLNIKDHEIARLEAHIKALESHIETLKESNQNTSNELIQAKAELQAIGQMSFIKRLTYKPKNI